MIKDLAKKNKEELEKLEAETAVSIRNFKFGMAGSKSRNVKEGRNLKKDLARIKTILNKSHGK